MSELLQRVVVVGATAWGTTLAVHLARKGLRVALLCRDATEAQLLISAGENQRLLPGVALPAGLAVTHDPVSTLAGAELVVLAVPAQRLRENARRLAPYLAAETAVMSAAKGLERESSKRMTEVLAGELPARGRGPVLALSGPNLAPEVAQGLPGTTVVASRDAAFAERVQRALMTPVFRVYTNQDVVGVELGGALKNIIALGAGMADGYRFGDNAKAAFITRGLAEMTRLGVAAGAQAVTFLGLAGLGDLVATCYSRLSRNRHVGEELARGRPLAEILSTMGHVAEGVDTVPAALRLARQLGVEMPITEQTHDVLFRGREPLKALASLLEREAKAEMSGIPPAASSPPPPYR